MGSYRLLLKRGSTLAWVLKHAPDGDRDAALARAWNEEKNVRTLGRFAWDFHPLARVRLSHGGLTVLLSRCYCRRSLQQRVRHVCSCCADKNRRCLRPPTWAEVEK